jgi:hypothetical protein
MWTKETVYRDHNQKGCVSHGMGLMTVLSGV